MEEGKNLRPQVVARTFDQARIEEERFQREIEALKDAEIIEPEPIDALEVYDMLRHIDDPEHPLTLEQLSVVKPSLIDVQDNMVNIQFTPTIPNCSMATLIGLMIRVKLERSLPMRFKVDVSIEPGKHEQEKDINKQLNDKERVLAALENAGLVGMVNKGLQKGEQDLEKYLRALKFD